MNANRRKSRTGSRRKQYFDDNNRVDNAGAQPWVVPTMGGVGFIESGHFHLNPLAGLRVDEVHRACDARIEGVDGAQDLYRLLSVD
jgi:hypothetical protein